MNKNANKRNMEYHAYMNKNENINVKVSVG